MQMVVSIAGLVVLLFGLIVAIIQLVLVGRQVKIMASQMQSQLNWNKKKETLDYVARFHNELQPTISQLQDRFGLLRLDGMPLNVYDVENNHEIRKHLFNLVAYCDQLGLGISSGYYDDKIAFNSLCLAVTSIYKMLIPYVELRRNETGRNVASNFEHLAKRWQKDMENE